MTLTSLRPLKPTDLTHLSTVLRKQNARKAALPTELPEPILISVARDLRSLEDPDEDDDGDRASLAAPMMLVLTILLGSKGQNAMPIGERAMFDSLKSYQWAVEREIVTRLTGIGGRDDMDILLRRLGQITSDDSPGKPVIA